jgi:uncharacterized protein YecE (DUF72 family)
LATARIGTSGWSYDHWRDVLYTPATSPAARLGIYTQNFDTVELNASFYRWPRESTFQSWQRRLPAGFQLSVKAPRGLTHGNRLHEPEVWIERITRCWHELSDRRGVLLVQLPPGQVCDLARLDYFLGQLPPWIRVAVEFRHRSWHNLETYALLKRHHAAYCVMSGADLPCELRATAPFVYVRMHGPDQHNLYAGSYSDADLSWWAGRIREWNDNGRDVYAYFNNDGDGNAIRNARTLRALVDH